MVSGLDPARTKSAHLIYSEMAVEAYHTLYPIVHVHYFRTSLTD